MASSYKDDQVPIKKVACFLFEAVQLLYLEGNKQLILQAEVVVVAGRNKCSYTRIFIYCIKTICNQHHHKDFMYFTIFTIKSNAILQSYKTASALFQDNC